MSRPVDLAIARFASSLRAAGFSDFDDAIERAGTDRSRANTLDRHTSEIPVVGRNAWLRRVAAGLWRAYDAQHRADDEAIQAHRALDTHESREDPR